MVSFFPWQQRNLRQLLSILLSSWCKFSCLTATRYDTQIWYSVSSLWGDHTCCGVCSNAAACHSLFCAEISSESRNPIRACPVLCTCGNVAS
ncbi:hypothetical protein PF005_g15499 [Phytophthora fragariae]|uniref:Secreted protein n=1 Tax=Phytophthora fragariae TaxID=53985 RepID=A0A6A3SGX9_9STRA|nr:hypothetical protein PF003_g38162 [Phytophthora fragariae]KAE8931584.1 hypothetical protein PF009_g18361 [Phytophthora fragariae]KAE8988931.1 hypothetical protein PF011_g18978 [Phytophthora fragariae]KAE9085906.1 hypothetical protein PF007_g20970 [Phytophthora fragariae]KAE9088970.1 hypothetical protein PF010_g19179 [Phytophthora fragariae]